ncbi:hypothetical protein NE237_025513 [Protea cynaroides]|uniref:Tetratricopeptide repeat protein n=1 Tax=Protea cynaroides TaxID=273540 RepID=A0A9Q0H206_9MAGN|nr:hypothetical protein NE237_025513 [Protea cynaroides]
MSKKHSIQPGVEHYVCLIDLLGRAGKVEEAEELALSLPFEPGLEIWGALLGICGLGKMNPTVARRAAERVLQLDPFNAPAHLLLCNIYATIGLQCEEGMLRKTMGTTGIRKVPGCSWIMTIFFLWFALSGWLFRVMIFATWVLPFAAPLLIGTVANNYVIQGTCPECKQQFMGYKNQVIQCVSCGNIVWQPKDDSSSRGGGRDPKSSSSVPDIIDVEFEEK